MESILVSACLLGVNCKYSGGNNRCPAVVALKESYHLVPICPEAMGGLSTPRPPAERQGGKVINKEGSDVTAQYLRGAEEAASLGTLFGCKTAILKSRSPACGSGVIYDGSFTGTKISGDGVAAAHLKALGYTVFTEEDIRAGVFIK